uniref:Chemosensory protein 7 n=1 Tax=Subpsaltria yangi TaxID=1195109 RepID=A0A385IUP9_9HEMI|nr:chemosensory protein 7 [Subpsaltria yangi]
MNFLMKTVLLVGIVTVVTIFAVCDAQKYPTRFDHINVDAILRNDRILKRYIDCVMDRGRCTAEGKELKQFVPDALKTNCAKCSDTQRKQAIKVMTYLIENKPNYWRELTAKYDPDGNYRRTHGIKD